jgi:hypothetical protein
MGLFPWNKSKTVNIYQDLIPSNSNPPEGFPVIGGGSTQIIPVNDFRVNAGMVKTLLDSGPALSRIDQLPSSHEYMIGYTERDRYNVYYGPTQLTSIRAGGGNDIVVYPEYNDYSTLSVAQNGKLTNG